FVSNPLYMTLLKSFLCVFPHFIPIFGVFFKSLTPLESIQKQSLLPNFAPIFNIRVFNMEAACSQISSTSFFKTWKRKS
ncbi:MAG: hypothetical protein MJ250_08840, partial [Alphaproteobacteria bacterium]|nr:hypothetical protein [Alphaproteobacteria bacterium]